MSMLLSGTNLLLGAGDFLTIYLFGYMQRSFCEKRDWIRDKNILVPIIYLLDWLMLFGANMMEFPPLNLAAMISAYMIPLFLIYQVKSIRSSRVCL